MILTQEKLTKLRACSEGIAWFLEQKESDSTVIFDKLLETNHFQWATWWRQDFNDSKIGNAFKK